MNPLQFELETSLSVMASVSLDVDLTLLFQLGLFLVLVVVLRALVFRPYLDNLDARTARTDDTRNDAAALREKADQLAERHQAAIATARSDGLAERGGLRTEGQAHKDEVVGRARAEASKSLEAGRVKVEADLSGAREELLGQVDDIARLVAEKVLGRSV